MRKILMRGLGFLNRIYLTLILVNIPVVYCIAMLTRLAMILGFVFLPFLIRSLSRAEGDIVKMSRTTIHEIWKRFLYAWVGHRGYVTHIEISPVIEITIKDDSLKFQAYTRLEVFDKKGSFYHVWSDDTHDFERVDDCVIHEQHGIPVKWSNDPIHLPKWR